MVMTMTTKRHINHRRVLYLLIAVLVVASHVRQVRKVLSPTVFPNKESHSSRNGVNKTEGILIHGNNLRIETVIDGLFVTNNWTMFQEDEKNMNNSNPQMNRYKPTLWIHVGPRKTASTTLQLSILGNRKF
jgi:hypothetical protein